MEKEYWFVLIAAILYGTIIAGGHFFVNLGLSLFEISLYRVLFISLALLPVVLIKRALLIKKRMLFFFIIYGLIGAFLELFQFGGIALGVPVAVVALLIYSQPIWTILFGRLILNEKITLRKFSAVFVAISGVILILKSWDIQSPQSLLGIISSLLGGVFLSLWIIWGRISGTSNQHYVTTTFGWTGFSVLWLLLLWPVVNIFITEPSVIRISTNFQLIYWLYLAIFAFIGGVIPHLFFYRGIQKVQAGVAGIILLLEPVSATLLASIFFNQTIGINIIIGGVLILISNYLVIHKQQ
jgi:drug/metabolite transporter (DMT)-like permease